MPVQDGLYCARFALHIRIICPFDRSDPS